MMIKAVLLICALALFVGAVCSFAVERGMKRRAVRTRARVLEPAPLGGNGQLVPMVEFTDSTGRLIRHSAQRFGAFGVRTGEETDILYTHKKVLGLDAWNIFVLARPDANPFRLYRVAGIFLAVLGVVLAALALVLG